MNPGSEGAGDVHSGLRDYAALWIANHVVQLLLILLLAVAVYWLTEGLTSTAVRVSRVALLPYSAFDASLDSAMGWSCSMEANSRPPSKPCCRV